MAGEWRIVSLKDAPLEILDGDRGTNYPNLSEFSDVGHCLFLNAGNVTTDGFKFNDCVFITAEKDSLLRKGKLVRNDIVLTTRGTVGNTAYFDDSVPFDNVRINSGMVIFRATGPTLHPRYLYFFVRSALFHEQVEALRTGSAQPQLPIRDINRIEIPLPPPITQQAIAHILGSLDDKIETNRKMNETLEAMARAIFKSWFVDFDPVHAKAAGRKPHGMDSATAALFPDSFVDSPLGKIPKGWHVAPFSEAIEVNPTRSLSKNTVVPYVDMQNMPTAGHRPLGWIDRPFGSGMRFMNGDTLVARITPCLENGKTAFVDFLEEGQVAWGSTEYIVIRPKLPLPLEFGYYLARSDDFRTFVIFNMTGSSGRQRAPANCFNRYDIVVPTKEVAAAFGSIVPPLMREITSNDNQSRALAEICNTLLPKLLSGELRIKDAEGAYV